MFTLLQVANSFDVFKRQKAKPVNKAGWNGLPEDVFHLIVNGHLNCDIPTIKSISTTCKAYALFTRPYIFPTISIAGPDAMREFQAVLIRYPWVVDVVKTLRLTDTDRQMNLHGMGRAPVLTPLRKDLVHILSQKYTQLKNLELPLLHGHHQWPTLAQPIKGAIFSLLHHHQLEEVSITTHYPSEILRPCSTIRRLELRIYPDTIPALDPEPSSSEPLSPLDRHQPADPPLPLQEFIIQDPWDLASSFTPQLIGPQSCFDLTTLQCLTYYGDNAASSELSGLLPHCANALSTLKLFVGGDGSNTFFQKIDILSRLSHITLTLDSPRSGLGPESLVAWLHTTISVRIIDGYLKQHDQPLQSVHTIVRMGPGTLVSGDSVQKCWRIFHAFGGVFKLARDRCGLSAHGDLPLRRLRSFRVSVALNKRTWGLLRMLQPPPNMINEEYRATPHEIEGAPMEECMQYVLGIAVLDFIEDNYYRWPVFPKDEGALV